MTAATTDQQIVQVPIDDLHPDPANPRKISDAELDALTRSMREFGFVQPVIARRSSSTTSARKARRIWRGSGPISEGLVQCKVSGRSMEHLHMEDVESLGALYSANRKRRDKRWIKS